jgi:hypothetical protein
VNGLGAKTIYKDHDVALESGDIESGQEVCVIYDGTQFEMASQKATDISTANKTTLTGGAVSDADALHYHPDEIKSINFTISEGVGGSATIQERATGFNDATTKLISIDFYDSGTSGNVTYTWQSSNDIGTAMHIYDYNTQTSATDSVTGAVMSGTDVWTTTTDATAGDRIRKNGTAVTIVGGDPNTSAQCGIDSTNSYFLDKDSTTRIRRYSGIAGTTLTLVSDITLANACDMALGFAYDNTNQRYICVDTTNNLIRRFNSSGTLIDSVAYTISDANVRGCVILNDRVYLVTTLVNDSGDDPILQFVDFIPTTMKR